MLKARVMGRFEFSVSVVELHRRTLDVAVKNGGSILSKHKGLLGKVISGLFLGFEASPSSRTVWNKVCLCPAGAGGFEQ